MSADPQRREWNHQWTYPHHCLHSWTQNLEHARPCTSPPGRLSPLSPILIFPDFSETSPAKEGTAAACPAIFPCWGNVQVQHAWWPGPSPWLFEILLLNMSLADLVTGGLSLTDQATFLLWPQPLAVALPPAFLRLAPCHPPTRPPAHLQYSATSPFLWPKHLCGHFLGTTHGQKCGQFQSEAVPSLTCVAGVSLFK